MVGLAVLAAVLPLFEQGPPPITWEWVVKDVAPAPHSVSGEESAWWTAFPMTDVDGDFAADTYWHGESVAGVFPNNHHTGFRVTVASGWPSNQALSFRNRTPFNSNINASYPNKALLSSPFGSVLAFADHDKHGISFYSLAARQILGSYVGPGNEGYGYRRAGDQNNDGFEDLFVWSTWSSRNHEYLLDGRTRQVVWESTAWPDSFVFPNTPTELSPSVDCDLDGRADLMMFWGVYTSPSTFEHHLSARRGFDGALIWEHICQQPAAFSIACTGMDFTGDQFPDAVLRNGATDFEAVNGADGLTLWVVPQSALQSWIPAGYVMATIGSEQWLTRSVENSLNVDFNIVVDVQIPWTSEDRKLIVRMEARTGQILDATLLPFSQSPWFQEPLEDTYYSVGSVMGDVDRDGIKEFGRSAPAPNSLVISDLVPYRWATLGLRTWFVPEQAQVGTTVAGSISIPSAPNHRFNLLLSRGFDSSGGVRMGSWKTHLASDSLLTKTMTDHPFTGRLGPNGQGVVSFMIPNDANLVGQTLYSKVVVQTPGNPNEVWTLSTLGQTQIVP